MFSCRLLQVTEVPGNETLVFFQQAKQDLFIALTLSDDSIQ